MPSALIIGGSGQIGRAVAARLLETGWSVACAQRDPDRLSDLPALAGARSVRLDRETPGELAAALAGLYGAAPDFVKLDGPPRRSVGATPWSVAGPIIADQTAARALGYAPTTYADRVEAACRSAEARAAAGLPFIGYLDGLFDYAAEDRILDP